MRVLVVLVLTAGVFSIPSLSHAQQCTKNWDCNAGYVCKDGKCVREFEDDLPTPTLPHTHRAKDPTQERDSVFQFSFGACATGGGNLWTKPSSTPPILSGHDVYFAGTRGGGSAGGGFWFSFRFFEYLELEVDFLFEWSILKEHHTHPTGPKYPDLSVNMTATNVNFRLPLLVKGVLPLHKVQLSLGLGPEFVIPVSTSSAVDADPPSGSIFSPPPSDYVPVRFTSSAATMLTMALGVTVEITPHLVLPIALRASYSFTQPEDYSDRVELYTMNNTVHQVSIIAVNSWDFRVLLGIGYKL